MEDGKTTIVTIRGHGLIEGGKDALLAELVQKVETLQEVEEASLEAAKAVFKKYQLLSGSHNMDKKRTKEAIQALEVFAKYPVGTRVIDPKGGNKFSFKEDQPDVPLEVEVGRIFPRIAFKTGHTSISFEYQLKKILTSGKVSKRWHGNSDLYPETYLQPLPKTITE